MRRLIVAAVAAVAIIVGLASVSNADPDVSVVRVNYASAAWGTAFFKAQCPDGSTPVGGGGFGKRTDAGSVYLSYSNSSSYNDGHLGWGITVSVPQSGTWTVSVWSICRL